jgi:hypothetical protein
MKGFLNKVSGGAKPTGKMNEAGVPLPTNQGIESTPRADISLPKTQVRRYFLQSATSS